jgi:AraC-like DNA-binding protein
MMPTPCRHAAFQPQNRFFTGAMLEVLLRPQAWRLVAAALPAEVEPVEDERHQSWTRAHTHSHAHQEVLIPLAGQGRFGLAGRTYPSAPGTIFVIDSFEEHDVQYPEWTSDLDHLWINALRDPCVARLITVREGVTRVSGAWSCLIPREEAGPPLDPVPVRAEMPPSVARLRMVGALSLLIGAIVRRGYAAEQAEERDSFQERIVQSVREHIEHTAGNGATLEHLARIAGYSTFHFLRLFKKHTGCTVHEYIDRCRLRRAREMQAQGRTRKEIAAALGFSCPTAFSRWYRSKTTPPPR